MKPAGWTIDFEDSPDRFTAHKGGLHLDLQSGGSYYYMHVVKVGVMKQEVTADAAALGTAIPQALMKTMHGKTGGASRASDAPQFGSDPP